MGRLGKAAGRRAALSLPFARSLQPVTARALPGQGSGLNAAPWLTFVAGSSGGGALRTAASVPPAGVGLAEPASVPEYTARIHACARAADASRAEWWFNHMVSRGFRADLQAYNALLSACAQAGDPHRAERIFNSISAEGRLEPDLYSYSALIRSCEGAGSPERAEEHFANMLDAGVAPSRLLYNSMTSLYAGRGDTHAAHGWFEKMTAAEARPDVVSFNSMITAFGKAGQLEGAEEWHTKLQEAGLRPDAVTYTILAKACIGQQRISDAERWFSMAAERGVVGVPLYNCMIEAYGEARQPDKATNMFGQLQRSSSAPPEVSSWNALLRAYALQGTRSRQQVGVTLSAMRRAGVQPDATTYTTIIKGFASTGAADQAERWFKEMIEAAVDPNIVTYTALAEAWAKQHREDKADALLADMTSRSVEPNQVFFNVLIRIYDGFRNAPSAEAAFRQMVGKRLVPDLVTYTAVAKVCARSGDLTRAESWLSRARAADQEPDVKANAILLTGCAQVGDLRAADQVLDTMREMGFQENTFSHTALISTCEALMDGDEAERRFRVMLNAGIKPNKYTLNAMVNVFVATRQPEKAERWLLEIARMGVDVDALAFNGLLRAFATAADPVRIKRWMARMFRVGVLPDLQSYNILINACARAGDAAAAEKAFEWIEQRGFHPSLASYRALVKAFAREGDHHSIRVHLFRMEGKGIPFDPLCARALVSACANAVPAAGRAAKIAFETAWKELRKDTFAVRELARAVGPAWFETLAKQWGLDRKLGSADVVDAATDGRGSPRRSSSWPSQPSETASFTLGGIGVGSSGILSSLTGDYSPGWHARAQARQDTPAQQKSRRAVLQYATLSTDAEQAATEGGRQVDTAFVLASKSDRITGVRQTVSSSRRSSSPSLGQSQSPESASFTLGAGSNGGRSSLAMHGTPGSHAWAQAQKETSAQQKSGRAALQHAALFTEAEQARGRPQEAATEGSRPVDSAFVLTSNSGHITGVRQPVSSSRPHVGENRLAAASRPPS